MHSQITCSSASVLTLGIVLLASATLTPAQAQISGKSITSFTTEAGKMLHVGDTVRIGRGSGVNGAFRYVFIPSNMFTGTPQKFFTSDFAGSAARIKDLKVTESSTYGIQTVAVIKGDGLLSGCIVINSAENAGELRTKPVARPVAAAAAPAPVNVTDELIKLKKLFDAKVLTQAEFTTQKNRLLNQQVNDVAGKADDMSAKKQVGNDIDFRLVSAVGDKRNQTVTVTISFTNEAANKANFRNNVRSCTSTDGDEFILKSGMMGTGGGFITLFTGAPLKGTFIFGGILPRVTVIKLMAFPYRYTNQANSSEEGGQVEFRNIAVIWK